MTPIGELRAAIPLGIIAHDLGWLETYGWAVLGNLLPVPFLLWGLEPASRFLGSFPNPGRRFLAWRTGRLRERRAALFQRWGALALVPFVAIPLPVTGAWSGCLAAWAFGLSPWKSLVAIAVGVLIAGAIVTALVELGVNFPFLRD
jgi:uncharacterized membrane protein